MKLIKTLFCTAIVGALTLGATKMSAMPLFLTSAGGSISSTSTYGLSAAVTTTPMVTKGVTLKDLMGVVTNQVRLNTGTNPPAGARIVFDSFTFTVYLTNGVGKPAYFQPLSGIVDVFIDEIATTFHIANNGNISENDKANIGIDIFGTAHDGFFYEFEIFGQGTINYTLNNVTGKGTMSMALGSGADFGEFQNSDSGSAKGSFHFGATGMPEWAGPYSVFWWNN